MRDNWQGVSEEETEEAENDAFKALFVQIVEGASEAGSFVGNPILWTFEMRKGDRKVPYNIWINPYFLDRANQPQHLLIQLSDNGGLIQEFVALSRWDEGKPQVTGVESTILDTEKALTPLVVATQARKAVVANYAAFVPISARRKGALPPPPGQTGLVN